MSNRMFKTANPSIQAKVDNLVEDTAKANERPRAKYWANLVVDEGMTDDQGNPLWTKLTPYGLALDTMPHAKVTSSKSDFNQMLIRTNAYLDGIIEKAKAELKPGESMLLSTNVRVQIYATNDEDTEVTEENANRMVNIF